MSYLLMVSVADLATQLVVRTIHQHLWECNIYELRKFTNIRKNQLFKLVFSFVFSYLVSYFRRSEFLAALEGFCEGKFVGVLEVGSHGQAAADARNFYMRVFGVF
jgi:hypothetical protein